MKIRFYIALWAAKLSIFALKITKHNGTNFPGTLALKICPDFLKYADKPKKIIGMTGTNGKTTSTNLICDMLLEDGKNVLSNRAGSNLNSGISTSLVRGMNIFGKQTYEIGVFEMDERSALKLYPFLKPDYLIVSNLARDSIGRNAHPEYIFNFLNNALKIVEDKTTLILNSDDPLSSNLGKGNKRVFYGATDDSFKPYINSSPDVAYCPYCGGKIKYNYRFYRSLGDFYCEDCDYKTPKAKYVGTKIDLINGNIYFKEDSNEYVLPSVSKTIYNSFNEIAIVSLFRELGYPMERIIEILKNVRIPDNRRETAIEYDGVQFCLFVAKGQLASSSSTNFEYIANDDCMKDLVICMDEETSGSHPDETLTWMYEADYEILNNPKIRRIIICGHMCLNTKLRLLLAGVPEDKIVTEVSEHNAKYHISTEGIDKVYILSEVDSPKRGPMVRNEIIEYLKGKKENEK